MKKALKIFAPAFVLMSLCIDGADGIDKRNGSGECGQHSSVIACVKEKDVGAADALDISSSTAKLDTSEIDATGGIRLNQMLGASVEKGSKKSGYVDFLFAKGSYLLQKSGAHASQHYEMSGSERGTQNGTRYDTYTD